MKRYEAVIETTIRVTDIVEADTELKLRAKINGCSTFNRAVAARFNNCNSNTVLTYDNKVFVFEKDCLTDEELVEAYNHCISDGRCNNTCPAFRIKPESCNLGERIAKRFEEIVRRNNENKEVN